MVAKSSEPLPWGHLAWSEALRPDLAPFLFGLAADRSAGADPREPAHHGVLANCLRSVARLRAARGQVPDFARTGNPAAIAP